MLVGTSRSLGWKEGGGRGRGWFGVRRPLPKDPPLTPRHATPPLPRLPHVRLDPVMMAVQVQHSVRAAVPGVVRGVG